MKIQKDYLLGIDLGGTQLRFVLADYKTGNITNLITDKNSIISYDSPLCGKKELFENEYFNDIPDSRKISAYIVKKLIEYLKYLGVERNNIAGIGISVAGKIQEDFRFIGSNVPLKYATKMGKYYGVDLISELKELFPKNINIAIENDGNCSGLVQALYYKYIGINPNTTFYITISTGIGGGGPKRDLDEIGHIIVDGYFPYLVTSCGCGAKGCIETYASGKGLINQALSILNLFFSDRKIFEQLNTFEYIRSENKYNLHDIINCSILKQLYIEKKEITTKDIFNFANIENINNIKRDQFSFYLVDLTAERLAKVIVSLSNIHGIERFGLGGSIVHKNPIFLDIIQQKISLIYPSSKDLFKNELIIELSPLGENIANYGALFLVIDPVYEINWLDTITQSFRNNS